MRAQIDITPIILAILPVIGSVISVFLVPLLKEKLGEAKFDKLMKLVTVAVEAAEQLCRSGVISKDERNRRVKEFLESKGYTVNTDEIDNMIEAAVSKLPPLVVKEKE